MTNLLFSAAAEEWMDHQKMQLKHSSQVRYRNLLNLYLIPEFGDVPIDQISREKTAAFSMQMLHSGGEKNAGLSPKTVSSALSVLKAVLSFAHQEKGCRTEDVSGVSVRQVFHPLRVFSLNEQQRLSRYLCRTPSLPNIGILIALFTGMRLGEICALRWEDICLEEGFIHVHQTMQRIQTLNEMPRTRVIVTEPKSLCSIRQIPIPDSLYKILKPIKKPPKCFFLTGHPNRFMEPRTMENRFRKVIHACGITNATFHTCRHTFATRCIELGFDIKSLSEILGHASVNITMNRYVHPSLEFKRENMNKLSNMIFAPPA